MEDEYITGRSVDGKEICLQTLGRSKLPEVVNDFLEFDFSDTVATQDVHSGANPLALNTKARGPQWEWIEKNNRGYDQALGVISDTVRGNADYKQRDEVSLLE
jgi:hypothetical protein